MDPTLLASQALALLSPYLAKMGQAAVETAGDAAVKQAEALLAALRKRFGADKDTYADQTLDKVLEEPAEDWPKQNLENVLASKARKDPAFKAELEQLLKDAQADRPNQQFNVTVTGGQVRDINQIGSLETLNSGDRD